MVLKPYCHKSLRVVCQFLVFPLFWWCLIFGWDGQTCLLHLCNYLVTMNVMPHLFWAEDVNKITDFFFWKSFVSLEIRLFTHRSNQKHWTNIHLSGRNGTWVPQTSGQMTHAYMRLHSIQVNSTVVEIIVSYVTSVSNNYHLSTRHQEIILPILFTKNISVAYIMTVTTCQILIWFYIGLH
jgi:hypothetical protein